MPFPIIPILAGLTGAGVGAALSGGGKEDQFTQIANRFGGLEKPLTEFYGERIGETGPTYPGGGAAAVAPMSPYEQQSFDFLRKFGEGGFGSTFQAGKSQIEKTLTNQFDPTTSPYYQAVKAEAARNLEETQKGIADKAAGGGRYYTGARVAEQARAGTEQSNMLNIILGGLAESERDRALSVIPQALQYGQAEFGQPLQKAAAFQSLGALPREIEQAMKSFDVGQWQQSEQDYPIQIAQMLSALLTENQPVLQQNQPSVISQLMGGIGQGAGNIGTAMLLAKLIPAAGCWVAAEIFGGWEHPKTVADRFYINNFSPFFFKKFYLKHGEKIAKFISNKPILKMALRPLFEVFAYIGKLFLQEESKGGV